MRLFGRIRSYWWPVPVFSVIAFGCAQLAEQEFAPTRTPAPAGVLLADDAVEVTVAPGDIRDGLQIPPALADLPPEKMRKLKLFRKKGGNLEPLSFEIAGGRLLGDFRTGDRILVHAPFTPQTALRYSLFCRLRAIDRTGGNFDIPDICPVILCPAAPYRADRLLTDFPQLSRFPGLFGQADLSRIEIRPMSARPGTSDICRQCLGAWQMNAVPGCMPHEPDPAPRFRPDCWVSHGPGPTTDGQVENIDRGEVVGAINAVALHPADPDIAYAGAVNGGIWSTGNLTDAEPHWRNLTDSLDSQSIGALAFDPTDPTGMTLWAGFGATSSFLRLGGEMAGVIRTTDGYEWRRIPGGDELEGLDITGIAPRGDTIIVGARNRDRSGGVWRSTDGGRDWRRISGAALPSGRSFDLVGDPGDTARLYVHAASGLYRSDDTGASWTRISSGALAAALSGAGNVEMAVGSNNNIYVAIVTGSRLSHLFRSGNAGASWTPLDLPQTTERGGVVQGIHPYGQGTLHLSIAADPGNDFIVYLGGSVQPGDGGWPNSVNARDYSGRLFRVDASRPRGSQAAPLTHVNTAGNSAPHGDSRDMAFAADGDLIEVNDGGIYRRTAPRTNTGDWFSLNGNIRVTELHGIAWDSNADIILGGAQDTGSPEETASGGSVWRSVNRADGGDVAVDDTGTPGLSVRYTSWQYLGGFRRTTYDSDNVFQSRVSLTPIQVTAGSSPVSPQFYTPLEVNNENPSRLVMGAANSVYESADQGTTWNEIGDGRRVNGHAIAYGAEDNADVLYVGVGRRVLVRTTATGALTASSAYPGRRPVLDVAIDPRDSRRAFAIDDENVFMTVDGGAGWENITGNLGALNAGGLRSVVFGAGPALVPDRLAVGTDRGVFFASRRGDEFSGWYRLGCRFPTVPVSDLDYDSEDHLWVAGTMGRGAWTLLNSPFERL